MTPSLQFTLGVALSVGHSMGLEKCVMTHSHHDSITEDSFTALKFSVLCRVIPPSPLSYAPLNSLFLSPCSDEFSVISKTQGVHKLLLLHCFSSYSEWLSDPKGFIFYCLEILPLFSIFPSQTQ